MLKILNKLPSLIENTENVDPKPFNLKKKEIIIPNNKSVPKIDQLLYDQIELGN